MHVAENQGTHDPIPVLCPCAPLPLLPVFPDWVACCVRVQRRRRDVHIHSRLVTFAGSGLTVAVAAENVGAEGGEWLR